MDNDFTNKPVDFIIFMLGTNDCNADLHLSPEDIAAGMERLVNEVELQVPDMQDFIPKPLFIKKLPRDIIVCF